MKSEKRLREIEQEEKDNKFWDDPKNATSILKEKSEICYQLSIYKSLENSFSFLKEMISSIETIEYDMRAIVVEDLKILAEDAKKKAIETLFKDEIDYAGCIMEIQAGAGGTDSNDWAEMLLRMYVKWAERRKYSTTLVHITKDIEAGIKSASIKIEGRMAYGWCKTEIGVHRLVRMSPFNKDGKRHTSFASIAVIPIVDDKVEIEINPTDLRIDTYRSSGAGGQHVNTTDSAVRITHTPTGVTVQSQNNRSQHQNKDECMKMLKSKLYAIELQKRSEERNLIEEGRSDIGWGAQIRSYVFQPYQMVKDLRSGYQVGDIKSVMDGDLDAIMMSCLKDKKSSEN